MKSFTIVNTSNSPVIISMWIIFWTILWLLLFEMVLKLAPYNPPPREPNKIQKYLEYGRSVEGKVRRMIGATDATTVPVTLIGWLDAEKHDKESQVPTHATTPGGMLMAMYGMSFVARLAAILPQEDPTLTVRFWGGPAAPLNHAYKAYQLDRGRHTAAVVAIGINASGLVGMTTFTSLNQAFEYPLPYTYPKYRKKGEQLEEIWPSVRSMDDFRRCLNDKTLWANYQDQLAAEDSYYHPFLFHENFLDNFMIFRFLRRSWSKRVSQAVKYSFYRPSKGFNKNSEVIQTSYLIIKEFAQQVRNDGQLPIILLFNNRGFHDHLTVAMSDFLKKESIPFLDSHAIAPSDDPKNIDSDNFHYSHEVERKFARAVLAMIAEHKK